MSIQRRSIGLRAIAVVEVLKGSLAFFGFLWVALGRDTVPSLMARLVKYAHIDPDGSIASFFLTQVTHFNPMMLAGVVVAYIALRFVEAYGLWRERHWAEWLAAISATIYIPLEVLEIIKHPSWLHVVTLVVNISIVSFLTFVLWRSRSRSQRTDS